MSLDPAVRQRLDDTMKNHRVVLFMKGTPEMPMCGFSARTVGVMQAVAPEFHAVNVLDDPDIREGIKAYGSWPTIPQLYVDGELIGGCDIVTEMFNTGELHEVFGLDKPDRTPPEIEITDAAASKIREFMQAYPEQSLHFSIGPDWDAQFNLGPAEGHEIAAEVNGIKVLMDLATAGKAGGARIDWVETMQGEGLKLDLPGAPPPVQSMAPEVLQKRINDGERIIVVDVRPEDQRSEAPLEFARPLDKALMAELEEYDRTTPLVFVCAHGVSSQDVAEHYRKRGFSYVYNLEGGVEALLGR